MSAAEKPSNVLQFRNEGMSKEESRKIRDYYFGGCSRRSEFWPDRHSWGPWKERTFPSGAKGRERMCKTCGRWSDVDWLDDEVSQ